MGGYRDILKKMMVHFSKTLQGSSVLINISITSMIKFELRTYCETQVYLKSEKQLSRDLFIRNLSIEVYVDKPQCFQLLKYIF